MATRLLNNSPLSRLPKRVGKLEGVFEQLINTFHYDVHNEAARLRPIDAFVNDIKKFRKCTDRLQIDNKKSGRINPLGASLLITSYESLNSSLRFMGELRTGDGVPMSRHPRFAKIREELKRLGESVRLVGNALEEQSEADREIDPSYVNSRKLRQAVERHDANLGRNLRLKDLDTWAANFTGINWFDGKMVKRVANLYVLGNIPDQTWELRYRSRLPGRPYVLVMVTADLPGPDFLEVHGLPLADYFIAARLPSWRIVWKISWYSPF